MELKMDEISANHRDYYFVGLQKIEFRVPTGYKDSMVKDVKKTIDVGDVLEVLSTSRVEKLLHLKSINTKISQQYRMSIENISNLVNDKKLAVFKRVE